MASSAIRSAQQAKLDEEERERELVARLDDQAASVDALAEGLDVGIFICDSKATVLYANRKAEDLFRFENPVGRTLLAVTISYDLEQLAVRAVESGTTVRAEIVMTYPDERIALAEAWSEFRTGRVFVSVYDITSLRRLERIRTDFVANVSHELRTPLATIRTMAETIADEPEDTQLRDRFLTKILSEVDRLSLITQDLLILSASESIAPRRQKCDLADVLRSVVNQLAPKAKSKDLALTFSGPETSTVQANANQMTQVFLNLVENAINYTNEGTVSVVLQNEGPYVVVRVEDTGIGIPSDHIQRIFERFYRVDKGRSRATGGTGLGLSIVKHIVEAHGGSVEVDSLFGRGSSFIVRVPAESADSEPQDGENSKGEEEDTSSTDR